MDGAITLIRDCRWGITKLRRINTRIRSDSRLQLESHLPQKERMMLRRSPLVESYRAEITPPPPPDDALLQIDDLVSYMRFLLRHKYRILLSLLYAFVGGWIYFHNQPVVYRSKARDPRRGVMTPRCLIRIHR